MLMSSRANITYRFGFIALDLLGLMESDRGCYTVYFILFIFESCAYNYLYFYSASLHPQPEVPSPALLLA